MGFLLYFYSNLPSPSGDDVFFQIFKEHRDYVSRFDGLIKPNVYNYVNIKFNLNLYYVYFC